MTRVVNTKFVPKPVMGYVKFRIIKNILKMNAFAIEKFGIEKLTEKELYRMKINDLKNVETELIVQLGIHRDFDTLRYRR